MNETTVLERRSGVALWRQLAEALRLDIAAGLADANGKLPAESRLAERFGVNRHTIRAALSALAREGVVRAEQGRGTYVVRLRRLSYPIGRRTRFSAGLEGQAGSVGGQLLEAVTESAREDIAHQLGIKAGEPVLRLETLSLADGTPVSRSSNWFDAVRFTGLEALYRREASLTRALNALGIADYVRQSTRIEAHHASMSDARDLGLSPGAIVLVTQALNVDLDATPTHFAITRFAADLVELVVEGS